MASDPPRLLDGSEDALRPEADPAWQQLVEQARAGEHLALNELIETWRTYLFHLVRSEMSEELRQKVGVSDLVQSACLDIHLRFADFRGNSVEEWRGWLRRMMLRDLQDARRRFLDVQRRDLRRERALEDGVHATREPSDPAPSPRASLIAEEEAAALHASLVRLPEDYRLVLRLRNWDRLPFAEVGRQMNRTEEAVRKLWSRAIARLQQELDSSSQSE